MLPNGNDPPPPLYKLYKKTGEMVRGAFPKWVQRKMNSGWVGGTGTKRIMFYFVFFLKISTTKNDDPSTFATFLQNYYLAFVYPAQARRTATTASTAVA